MKSIHHAIVRFFSGWKHPSIRAKITALFASAIGVLSLFIAFYLPVIFEKVATQAIAVQARSIGTITAYSVSPALLFNDSKAIGEALDAALQDRTIVFLSLRNDSNKVVYTLATQSLQGDSSAVENMIDQRLREGIALQVEVPITSQDATIGHLRLIASTKEVRERITTTRQILTLISIAVFLLGLLIGWRISSFINAPIVAMAKTSKRIADGDLSERVVVSTRDEVGILANSFNLMVEKLEASHHALEEINRDLEGRVSSRTVELEREIAERIRVEEELRKLYIAVEQSSVSIAITDVNGIIEYVNSKFCAVSGYSREELIGSSPAIVKSGLTPEAVYRQLWDTIRAGSEWHADLQNRHRDGTLYWESVTISPIRNNQGAISHFLAVKEDITERMKLERQLLQAQKMESLGTLAGGIAHDFNNILGVILGFSSLLESDSNDPEEVVRSARSISDAVERGAAVVRQILTFARKTGVHAQLVDLNTTIPEVGNLLESSFPKTTTISLELAQDLPTILIDPTQLHQALLNLCVNARDAMSQEGTLAIATQERDFGEVKTRFPEATPSSYVEISVSDTGVGMTSEVAKRIFEPFYTTKDIGKGTGLGLSVVYGIVQSHNGFIDVRSTLGKGSTFSMLFPSQSRHAVGTDAKVLTKPKEVAGTETILVVEDEPELRKTLDQALRSHGYTTLLAADGRTGLMSFKQNMAAIQIMVTDIGLPGLDGASLIREVKKLNPSLAVIACSGFLNPNLKRELTLAGADRFVPKPYVGQRVLETIRELLDA
ncbi:MAG: PAS domain S-box protein [Ignavibacteriales bacterium]|nr:PAS domain S-box protein [Ignavibacteriales bacterium]